MSVEHGKLVMCVFWTWGSYASVSVGHGEVIFCLSVEHRKVIFCLPVEHGEVIYVCLMDTGS